MVVGRRSLLLGAAALALAPRARATETVWSNARILLGDGGETTGGVRVVDGMIAEVGPAVKGGTDLGGAVLFPGFWDGGSSIGLVEIDLEPDTRDDSEGSDATAPQARVVDGWNPASELLPVARYQGVLGGLVVPATGTLVSGRAAWMRFSGETTAASALLAEAGICINLGRAATGGGPNAPKTRMGAVAKVRDMLDANPPDEPDDGKKKKKKGDAGDKDEKVTRAQKAVRAMRARDTKAIVSCDRADDILVALDLVREYELDAVLIGCVEGWKVAKAIADAKVPVLLGPITAQPSGFSTLYASYENAATLHAAGVRFAMRQGDPHQLRDLPTEACVAVAHGLPWNAAIAAVCGNGPSFWGLQAGLIKPGYEATFALADADPLQPRTRVLRHWYRGVEVPHTSRQTELWERYKTLR
jgi:imidazolonepropionase-like amidohydrolase